MTLLVAAHSERDSFAFGGALTLPSVVVVDSTDFSLKDIITELD